jgi:hypothetical protein
MGEPTDSEQVTTGEIAPPYRATAASRSGAMRGFFRKLRHRCTYEAVTAP